MKHYWGYGIIVLATFCIAGFFYSSPNQRTLRELFPNGREPEAREIPTITIPTQIQPYEKNSTVSLYYKTGYISQNTWGHGYPQDLNLQTETQAQSFLHQGEDLYTKQCATCHGTVGKGNGILSQYKEFPRMGDLADPRLCRPSTPEGQLFYVISHGLSTMPAFDSRLSLQNRWAIVAYLRFLQSARSLP